MSQYKYTSIRLMPQSLDRLNSLAKGFGVSQTALIECILCCTNGEIGEIVAKNIKAVKQYKTGIREKIKEGAKVDKVSAMLKDLSPEQLQEALAKLNG
jgi:predicted DNA-binding protein